MLKWTVPHGLLRAAPGFGLRLLLFGALCASVTLGVLSLSAQTQPTSITISPLAPHPAVGQTQQFAAWSGNTLQLGEGGAVSGGGHHTCAVLSDGTVRCWGYNLYGQLGDGTTTTRSVPAPVSGLSGATGIGTGRYDSCALLSDGTVKCWGNNYYGGLGDGTTADRSVPVSVSGLSGATAIGSGYVHNCALLSDGTVKCWGDNGAAQLGDGTLTSHPVPVFVSGLSGATAITAGIYHTCALLWDGTVKCWGFNGFGALGDGTTTTRTTPVSVTGLSGATAIVAGEVHTCALLLDGTVKCWGDNNFGELGDGTTVLSSTVPVSVSGLSGVMDLSAGARHTCALLSDGTVKCWGDYVNVPVSVTGLSGVRDIAGGELHTCAVLFDGRVKCWGSNDQGQLGDGTVADSALPVTVTGANALPGMGATVISAGVYNTCALLSDGTGKCWGDNSLGQLGDGTTTLRNTPVAVIGLSGATAIAVGWSHTCALLSDGTVKCWGNNFYGQLGDGTTTDSTVPGSVSGLSGVIAITAGYRHNCALLSDGTVKCWGENFWGGLGDGTIATRTTPVAVAGLSGVTAIVGGGYHTCALLSGGTVKCWGFNGFGQLGVPQTSSRHDDFRTAPVSVSGLSGATALAAHIYDTCALLSGGTVKCWGYNLYGALGDGTISDSDMPVSVSGLSGAKAIAAGDYHTCALLSDGTGKCWGYNLLGQLGSGLFYANSTTPVAVSGLSGAKAMTAGSYHTCALLSGGTVDCWGWNLYGQLGIGSDTPSNVPVPTSALVPSLVWTSSNTSAATIDPVSGLATAVGPGTTTITATYGALNAHTTLTINSNSPPTATSVNITGTPNVGQLLTGHYIYSDVDGDLEGTSTYRWLRDGGSIGGATSSTYTLVTADAGHSITFEVTPVAATGTSPGSPVQSSGVIIAIIVGSGDSTRSPVNLTAEGMSDWVHWGDASLNRKSGVTAQLSNYTIVGTGPVQKYTNDPRPLSWTDGTPTASNTNNTKGVYISRVGNGFSLTAPADTTTRTMIVHVGGWNSAGTLTTHLSDGSAVDFTNTTSKASGQYDRTYTLIYRAGAAAQTLTVTWVMTSGTGNVTLSGAALKSGVTVASIAATAGTPQSTTINTTFASSLQAIVKDAISNPINGASVTFTAPGSGPSGTFSGSATVTVSTDVTGVATAPAFTANTIAGSYAVVASTPGVAATVSFSLTNQAGAPASVTATGGTPQSTTVNTAFGTALQATAKDSGGNPVSGVTVTFTAPASGASGAFSGGSTTANVLTIGNGTATAPTFTANGQAASYTVTASVAGVVTPASFNLTNNALSGSGDSTKTAVNLTAEGTSDWVHWGDASFNRKAGVAAQLSNYTAIGGGVVQKYTNDPRPLSWTDGIPTASSSSNKNGVYISGVGRGFSITAPAGTATLSMIVHVGGWNSGGTLTAHLSDGSAPDYVNTTATASGQYDRNYTLTYRAGAAGQSLTVTWKMASGTGNVTVNGAALRAAATCTAPETSCDGTCRNLNTDVTNCGACGSTCPSGQVCSAGHCAPSATCTAPDTSCGGTCRNLASDAANCGACGNTCASGQVCSAGSCTTVTTTCTAPETSCDGTCRNLNTDVTNCGACGNTCPSGQVCSAGSCAPSATCTAPYTSCGGTCRNLASDAANCGACGNTCASGQVCSAGLCTTVTTTCTAPETSCDGTCRNLNTDVTNCGACGNTCPSGMICTVGACGPGLP